MSTRSTLSIIRRRLLGVAFLAVLALLVGLTVAIYRNTFTTVVAVTLRTDHVGNQLQEDSDVKVRGLIVGQVTHITSKGDHAEVELALQPDKVGLIPRNVSARLLPKTLFGERYVSLVLPDTPTTKHLGAGDVIDQDHTSAAIELEKVLANLMPLLQAVEPQKLATTLNALSGALDGRGKPLGDTLALLDRYLGQLNQSLPDLNADTNGLTELANNYSTAAPDLIQALSDLTTTSKTLVEERKNFALLYTGVTTASTDLTSFLQVNKNNLIALTASSQGVLDLLARYSPEYPCFLKNLADYAPRLNQAFGRGTNKPGLHLTLSVTQSRGKYVPGLDDPVYQDKRGPHCYDPAKPGIFPQYPLEGAVKDGTRPVNTRSVGSTTAGANATSTSPQAAASDLGVANSPQEREFIAALIGPSLGVAPKDVPQWSSFLVGPLLRGTEVTAS